jgi:hypothetical protein
MDVFSPPVLSSCHSLLLFMICVKTIEHSITLNFALFVFDRVRYMYLHGQCTRNSFLGNLLPLLNFADNITT